MTPNTMLKNFIHPTITLIAFLFAIQVYGQDTWIRKTDLSGNARKGAVSFELNGKAYVGTGFDGTYRKDIWEYDPATNTWAQIADLGGAGRAYAVGYSVSGKGYISTGYTGGFLADVWEWNPLNNTWTQKSNFAGGARQGAFAMNIAGKAYITTGFDGSYKKDIWEYAPLTDTWIQKTMYPGTARIYATGFVIGGKGYVGSGYDATYRKDFYAYDQVTNTWSAIADLTGNIRGGAIGFTVNGNGYVGLGDDGVNLRKDLWEYNPMVNIWSRKSDLPGLAREHAVAFTLGNQAYIVTGSDNGTGYYKDLWQWNNNFCNLSVSAAKTNITCNAANNGALDVSISGGTAPFTYSWSNGATTEDLTGLAPGEYTLNVSDVNACATQAVFRFSQPRAIQFGRDSSGFSLVRRGGGVGNDAGKTVLSDASGNIYVAGTFSGTAGFGSTNLTSIGGKDIFIAKYNNLGNVQWIQQIGGTIDEEIGGMAMDAQGNIYLTGAFRILAFFGTQMINSMGEADVFLVKLNNSGVIQWVQTGGSSFSDFGNAIHCDAAGNISITGIFQGMATFQGQNLVSNGGNDIFVARYNTYGVLQWIKQAGGPSPDAGTSIHNSVNGDIYVSGTFQQTAVFGSSNLVSLGDDDIFLARYDRYGNLLFAQQSGGTGNDKPNAMTGDAAGNIYLAGHFEGNASIGGNALVSNGGKDAFIAKLDQAGTAIYALKAGGTGDDVAFGLHLNGRGHAVISGSFSNTATFGTQNLVSAGGTDLYIARIDEAGAFRHAFRSGGVGNDIASSVHTDLQNNIFITGNFTNSFNPGTGLLTSAGGSDMLFGRFREYSVYKAPIITQVTCQGGTDGSIQTWVAGGTPDYSFLWSNGATTQNITGIGAGSFQYTATDQMGCTKDTTFIITSLYNDPTAPVSASIDRNNFCADDAGLITLTAVGGTGDSLKWYTGTCGSTYIGAGTVLVIPSPEVTTTYFARWENPCGQTTCANVIATVIPLPVAPSSVSSSSTTICAGTGSITLTATGGSGQILRWYSGSCGGTLSGAGNPITIPAPAASTTYFARWENSCGVSGCASVSITVNPLPQKVTSITVDTNNFCYNFPGTITLTAVGGSGNTLKWSAGNCQGTVIGTGPSIVTDAPTVTTKYYAWWENSCGPSLCDSITINVLVPPTPPVSASVSTPAYCLGTVNTITLTATGGSGTTLKWYKGYCGSPQLVGTGTPLTIPAPTSNTMYYARWETTCGYTVCVNTGVTVHPLPTASFTGLGGSYCINATPVTLTGNYIPSGTFSGNPGVIDNLNGTATFNPALAGAGGPFTVTYSYTDPNGCSSSASQSVTVRPLPFVNFAGLAAQYCVNANPVSITGNQAPYGSFNGTGITSSSNGVGVFNPSVAGAGGPYSITYSYTDIYGCSKDTTKTTMVNPLPVVSISGLATTYCINTPPVTIIGSPATNGFFSGPGITNIAPGQAVFDPAMAGLGGPYQITYSYTDVNGCSNIAAVGVTVFNIPNLNFSGLQSSYCLNASPSTLVGNMAPGGTFSGPGITPNTNGTAIFNPSTAGVGTHTITYSYTDPNGCGNTFTKTTTILPIPTVDFTGLNTITCLNAGTVLLTGNQAPFGNFSGPGITNLANGTATFNPVSAGVGGPFNITYTYTALNGCTNSIVKQTTVPALPTVNFTGLNLFYCINSAAVTLTGNQAPQGTFTGPGITDNANGTAQFNPTMAGIGTHTITYTYTDLNGCTNTKTKTTTINSLPLPTILGLLPEYCVNGSTDTITGSFNPLGTFSGPGITDLGIGQAIFNPAVAGIGGPYDIIYEYTDFNGCTNDTTYQVTVNAAPSVDFNPFLPEYCIDAVAVLLTGNQSPNGSFTGPGITDQGNGTAMFDPAVAGAGLKSVTYTYTDLNGCTKDTTKTTTVIALPVKPSMITVDSNNYCANTVVDIMLVAFGGAGDTLVWFEGSCGGTIIGGGNYLTIPPPNDTTTYYARWENQCGESECDSIKIFVIPSPLAPTATLVDTNNYCAGTVNIITLSTEGGIGATLKWFKNDCNGQYVGQGQPLIITAPTDTTTYYARWENECGISECDSIIVNVTPQPIAPLTVSVDTTGFCIGTISDITLTATGGLGDTLQWYAYACGDSLVGTGTPLTISAPDTTTVYYARWKNKCDNSSCLSVEVVVVPETEKVDSISVDQNDFCAGVVGIIQLSASGGSGTTLQWFKNSCGGTLIGTGTPILTNAPVDTATYYARWVNMCGESECDSIIINVRPQARPLDSLSVDTNFFCIAYNGLIALTAHGIFETGDTVQWFEGGCGTTLIGTGVNLSIPAPDTTTRYFARNINSCGESACLQIDVIVNEPVSPIMLNLDTLWVCQGYTNPITLTAIGGSGDQVEWFADSCGGTPVGSGISISIPAPDTTTTYFARWENYCGESECDSVKLYILEMPTAPDTISVDTNYYCANSVNFITLTAIGGYGDTISSHGETVRWFRKSCNGTMIGTGVNITIPAPIASTWYFARWENVCGVSECDSFRVIVHTAKPVDSITADTNNFCIGTVTNLTLTAYGGYGDLMRWAKIVQNDTINIGTGNPINILAPDTTTIYLVRMETYCGNSAWRPIKIKVNTPVIPDALFANQDTICSDFAGPLVLWGIGGNGDSLRWYANGCQTEVIATGDTVSIQPPTATTTYYANYENICGVTDCKSITIRVTTAPVFTAGANDSVCEGLSYTLKNASVINADSVLWTSSNGNASFSNPRIIKPIYNPGNINISTKTTDHLILWVFGKYPCGVYTDTMSLVINPKPEVSLTPPSPAICQDSSIMLTASGGSDYKWIPPMSLDTARGPVVIASPSQTKDYSIVGISSSGCLDTISFTLTVKPTPKLDLGDDLYLFSCEPVILDAGGGTGSESYEWQDGSQFRHFKVNENGTYWVRVFNDGCAVVDTISIELCQGYLYLPTAFSPNGDGINDVFKPATSDLSVRFKMYIYDRHGQLVFETDNVDEGWDGTKEGLICPTDVYIWLIRYQGQGQTAPGAEYIEKGKVYLLR